MDYDQVRVLDQFVRALDEVGISYAVGGSVASGYFGEPRATYDIDVLAALVHEQIAALQSALGNDFHVDVELVRDAVVHKSSFNVIHRRPIVKIDVFVAGDRTLDREHFEHRVLQPIEPGSARSIFVTSPESIVLRKLDWFRIGQLTSERQWNDVLGVLKTQRNQLDLARMQDVANQTGLSYLLKRAFDEAAISAH